ncbi:MAG: peptidylprolyl isomerase [Chloroflexi bacterium]|nr:peptidylprolyl isomerase [Chloroflexota bacterium]
MSDQEKRVVGDNDVVSLEYTLTVDGEVVDSSEGHGPIEYIQGKGQIIPGLEKEVYGMAVGESKEVVVSPAEGYGEENPEAFVEVPKSEFPPEIPLEVGTPLQLRDQQGQVFDATIAEVKENTVLLNFNHPLAGKTLTFQIKVVGVRPATQEELDHGHVHHH